MNAGKAMLELENDINENEGCWLYLDKLPPVEEEDPKKKAPAKAKGQVEELKPVFARTWIDFSTLKGCFENSLLSYRAPFETIIKLPDGVEAQPTD